MAHASGEGHKQISDEYNCVTEDHLVYKASLAISLVLSLSAFFELNNIYAYGDKTLSAYFSSMAGVCSKKSFIRYQSTFLHIALDIVTKASDCLN